MIKLTLLKIKSTYLEIIQSITLILEYIAKINKLMSNKLPLTSQIWVLDNFLQFLNQINLNMDSNILKIVDLMIKVRLFNFTQRFNLIVIYYEELS
jgi:hypothetical protein